MELVDQIGLVILSGTVLWVLSILLVDVYEVPFSKLRNGIEALWLLLTVPMQRKQEPLEADHTRIAELEHWNRTWSHPEIGDFYTWDGSSYVETSWKKTDSGLEYYTDRNTWITTVRPTGENGYDYTPGPGRVWSVPKGATLGSWCRSCKSPAHGAEYCRRCVDNYGYREGKKRYKLPNGRYVDTYEETLCEVCKEPLPLHWSRICSAECGQKQRDRCKDTMCGGYGIVYRDGRCKGCYEVRMKERRCARCGRTGAQIWGDGKRYYCNDGCREKYQTEP